MTDTFAPNVIFDNSGGITINVDSDAGPQYWVTNDAVQAVDVCRWLLGDLDAIDAPEFILGWVEASHGCSVFDLDAITLDSVNVESGLFNEQAFARLWHALRDDA